MTLPRNNLVCRCYFTKNYFVRACGEGFHVDYNSKEHLLNSRTFQEVAQNIASEELEKIFDELEKEKLRRHEAAKKSQERISFIKEYYIPLFLQIFTLTESYLNEEFLVIVKLCKDPSGSKSIFSHIKKITGSDGIYKIPIFKEEFCRMLVDEVENFQNSNMPKGKPNSMNNYGVLLEEMGFYEGFLNPLREFYLSPICEKLYPEILKDTCLDSQKAFVVTYKMDADVDLDSHFDNSEVTCNISLNCNFSDGELYFHGSSDGDHIPCDHKLGWGTLHLGSKLHGSMSISSGVRHNMIIWMRSSSIRNKICPMCQEKPNLVEMDGTGDGFSHA